MTASLFDGCGSLLGSSSTIFGYASRSIGFVGKLIAVAFYAFTCRWLALSSNQHGEILRLAKTGAQPGDPGGWTG